MERMDAKCNGKERGVVHGPTSDPMARETRRYTVGFAIADEMVCSARCAAAVSPSSYLANANCPARKRTQRQRTIYLWYKRHLGFGEWRNTVTTGGNIAPAWALGITKIFSDRSFSIQL